MSETVSPGADPAEPQSLEDRYGTRGARRRDRRLAWGAAAVLVAGGLAFALFGDWQQANRVEVQQIGFAKQDDGSVDVKFQVSAPPRAAVACAVEALNPAKATVGWKVVELPVSERRTHTVTARLVTTNPATAAHAKECWVLEDPGAAEAGSR